jgi:HD-GYP domain-containing protein (c-di-GMP phosphodiesterase class II)
MSIQVEKCDTQDLQLGMYVSQLDRPWIETPFPLQGFHIRSKDDIEKLRVWCRHVFIDRRLSKHDPGSVQPESSNSAGTGHKKKAVRGTLPRFQPVEYKLSRPLKREVAAAAPYHKEITRAVAHLLQDVRAGKGVNLRVARKAASVVVHSVLRNPDAMVWLARVKDQDSYTYSHSIRSSILATVFGRHIGLPQEVLENLATGVLLMDVGKLKVPEHLLTKPGALTSAEMREMRRHVQYGIKLLEEQPGINDQMLAVVQYHHERHDGSGYPEGLNGPQIPLLARIAGIVDTYDAVTSPRPWASARSSNEAVSMLYELRDTTFHGELVEQFIQSIGVYPTGTPVKLSNEAVGVVIAQNPSRRLRPQVMVVQDEHQRPMARPRIVDLMKVDQDDAGSKLSIAGGVPPDACQVDLARVELGAA